MVIVTAKLQVARTGYARPVDVDLVPEPPPAMRDALAAALARELEGGAAAQASRWWQAGIAESVEADGDYDETVARPLSSRGATRA